MRSPDSPLRLVIQGEFIYSINGVYKGESCPQDERFGLSLFFYSTQGLDRVDAYLSDNDIGQCIPSKLGFVMQGT